MVEFSHRKLVFYFLLLILVSCQYELPKDKYFNTITQTTPTAVISLTNYNNNDTIYIYQPTQFQFSVTANVTITEVDVILGSITLASFASQSGSFNLSSYNWTPGISSLKIQFTSKTGSGSLADNLGKETVTLWRSWVLVVDVSPPPIPKLSISNVNGFAKLSWTPFKRSTFLQYLFYTGHSNTPVTIKDPNVTNYVDR